jgi:plasmid rolling circle replication initiator protein Rep
VILVVDDKYFRSKDYISHSELMKLWRDCAGLDYDPWVRIQAVKPKPGGEGDMDYGKAVAEVAKYTVKAADFIVRPPEEKSKYYERAKRYAEEQTDEAVMILDKALTRRRLVAFGGVMKEVHKLLSLEDPESGDLINTDNEKRIRDDLFYVIERYRWSPGYRNYVLEAVEDQGGNDITEVANPFEEGA